MNKKNFYREQAEQFKGYFQKYPCGNLLSLFGKWCESKDIEGKDKHYIWKITRHFKPIEKKEIEKGSDEAVRIGELINVIFGADLEKLKKIAEKKEAE
ncbi:MAG: hypothetical protein NTX01_03145 [Candidatus Omnitrophica bacterium]|nr:hypothetical protein [Candidatus Omnitrophota bacterium]